MTTLLSKILHPTFSVMNKLKLYVSSCVVLVAAAGCIKNDIPYPRIAQNIVEIAAEGQSKEAYIDSVTYEATIYLEETTDIQNVRFSEYKVSTGGVSHPDLLDGTYDLSEPLFVNITRFQEYTWEVKAVQDIVRYFQVEGEVGESVVDPVAHRVIVNMPEDTDLSHLTLQRVKLGPEGITTISPELNPGPLDLAYPLRVNVTAHGRTEIWTIYAQFTDAIVTTTSVDAWSQVIWAYGNGPADVVNGFQYREASSAEWIDIPSSEVHQTQGAFSCRIPHLKPLTEYVVRAVSGDNIGNEIKVTTQATADIPGGDFENWYQNDKKMWVPWAEGGMPYWDSGNGGSITLGQNLTEPTDHVPAGLSGRAAQCTTKFVGIGSIGKLGAGSIFTGTYVRTDGTNGVLAFGRAWSLRPTRLRGYFQYKAKTIDYANNEWQELKGRPDSCHIYVALADWTAPYEIRTNPKNRQLFNKNAPSIIAYGELIYSGDMNDYKEFSIDLNYRDTSRIPTYLQITCATSKYGDYFTGGNGSVLYLDQFYFDWDY